MGDFWTSNARRPVRDLWRNLVHREKPLHGREWRGWKIDCNPACRSCRLHPAPCETLSNRVLLEPCMAGAGGGAFANACNSKADGQV